MFVDYNAVYDLRVPLGFTPRGGDGEALTLTLALTLTPLALFLIL